MTEGPLGGAAFNNEFGRPALNGYFRTYEEKVTSHNGEELRGYHKPIMLAGGIGNIRGEHVQKGEITVGAKLIVLGGPAMNIGLGGRRGLLPIYRRPACFGSSPLWRYFFAVLKPFSGRQVINTAPPQRAIAMSRQW